MYEHIFKHVCLVVYALHVINITFDRHPLEEIIEHEMQEQLVTTMSITRKAKGNRLHHV